MRKANEAYKKGDMEGLKRVLEEWENKDEKSFTKEAELIQVDQLEQKIRQIKLRIIEIKKQVSELEKSDLYLLMVKDEQAVFEGHDLLDEMAKKLQVQIREARKLLASLKKRNSHDDG